ncbi:MAG: hypothetical protein ACRC2U_00015, partial [Aeromonas sp.]
MEINRDSVNQWLLTERRSQSWLAAKCEVSKQAVSNWLRENNSRSISASAQIVILRLMEEDRAAKAAKPPHSLVLEFEDADYEQIESAAVKAGKSIRQWSKDGLLGLAEIDVYALA